MRLACSRIHVPEVKQGQVRARVRVRVSVPKLVERMPSVVWSACPVWCGRDERGWRD